ncbi:trimeric intracellular cation channel family protein [Arcanobacterium ihumii]|uniref:trimeric intracellular cation channel family protein n=1 Tax=Arcanobacterium ihumii TaxID=2138162 RepID=UPI000F54984E|nr:TRIC cation channel family protein [Arcanobacterium ihumii]
MTPEDLFRLVDVTGVIANGLIGAALARKHGYDLIGFLVLGAASALGGGLVRDMMLGIGFPVALTDPWYLGGAFAAATFAYFIPLESKWSIRALNFGDVLALGCWSATGASKGLSAGLGVVSSIFLGVVTAICGGMIRDVLVNQTPSVFGGNPLYATFSVLAAAQMVFFQSRHQYALGMGLAIVMCTIFGALARRYRWMFPKAYDLRVSPSRMRNRRIQQQPSAQQPSAKEGRRNLRFLRRQHEEQAPSNK